jgi:hypothetical protein
MYNTDGFDTMRSTGKLRFARGTPIMMTICFIMATSRLGGIVKYILLFALIIFLFFSLSSAQDYSNSSSAFIVRINSACKKADVDDFRSLYCKTTTENSRLALPQCFSSSDKKYDRSYLENNIGEHKYALWICYDSLKTEEGQCEFFDVKETDDNFCIVE